MRVALQRRELRQRKKLMLIKRKDALKEEKARVLQRREEVERKRAVAAVAVQVCTLVYLPRLLSHSVSHTLTYILPSFLPIFSLSPRPSFLLLSPHILI